MDRESILASFGIPISPTSRPLNRNAPRRDTSGSFAGRASARYSVTALYSMAAEQDVEVEDELAKGIILTSNYEQFYA